MMNEEYMFFMSDMLSDLYEEQQEEEFEAECESYDQWFNSVINRVFATFDSFANCFKEVPYEI